MIDRPALPHEHAFDIRINFDKRWTLGAVPGGTAYGFTSVGAGGTVSGPLLNGTVVDYSGADWPAVRGDRVVELNAHYMLLADDGTPIYIRNLGYVHGPIIASDQVTDIPPYFCCTPYFRAPAGPHEWLNRTVIVGIGERRPKIADSDDPDHTLFRYFAIR
jgi:hypothetical protein